MQIGLDFRLIMNIILIPVSVTSIKLIVFASFITFAFSMMTDCTEKDTLSSPDAYTYVARNYGKNTTFNAKQLYSYFNNLGLFFSTPEVMDCSIFNFLANLNNSDQLINSTTFFHICANILTHLDQDGYKFCENNAEHDSLESSSNKPSDSAIWGYGVLAVTIISLCSLVGISLLPLMKTDNYDKILLYLIALAVGTLSCNAIFQLIPEGFGINSDPMTVWQSTVIFGGFYVFYLTENILERLFNTTHDHAKLEPSLKTENNFSGGAEQGDASQAKLKHESAEFESREVLFRIPGDSGVMASSESDQSSESSLRPASVVAAKQKQCWIFKNYKSIKTVAWMITVADGIHNFIDGLAIGASFSTSLVQGLSTSLAIFCEEFPHELGDFAILISSGMTMRQAAFYNFASACCCYLGLFVGILVGSDFSSAQWIFALAGGVFLYISLAGMLPEAQAHCTKKSLKHSPWLCLFIKNAGLLSGFVIMLLLTLYQDKIAV